MQLYLEQNIANILQDLLQIFQMLLFMFVILFDKKWIVFIPLYCHFC